MNKPLIMGIVNVTPDSFSDGGKFFNADAAIAHGERLLEEGADILDIGGESTRPGSQPISAEEETRRVVPVIRALSRHGKIISIDTRNAVTMKAAIDAGAGFINDIQALREDGAMELAAQSSLPVCLMHMKGEPQNMQENPQYIDVVGEVFAFLQERIEACEKAGINRGKIYVDIGIGFGKTTGHNLELLRQMSRFRDLGVKLLLGASRKKFIENIMSRTIEPEQRLGGSLAAALWGIHHKADIIRVHDVAQKRQAFTTWSAIADE